MTHSKVPGFSIAAVKKAAHSGGTFTVGVFVAGAKCLAHKRKKSGGKEDCGTDGPAMLASTGSIGESKIWTKPTCTT